ncbi:Enoyl-(acyl-carrier-protein) reductase (NADH) chloroplastic [Citrus sinensis]|uniref:Enoyl-(Acyl-carrier-protein) reductase (NADH) chloroplastic n=1 Tax=Citrus sinensis TaxID=2711 RepID=A0ACB8JY84_CITSI|nr:Enoyl-(acyl-carrier-protein) reductase (NADH) chloroplastic [Citrus sinensis]
MRQLAPLGLPDGLLMEISKVYPLDAVYDNPEDVPKNEIAESVKQHFGSIDILVHSLVNGPKVQLLAFFCRFCAVTFEFAMHLNCGASISLTYMGSESFIPGKRCRQASHQITEALYLHLVVYRNNILTYNGTEEVGNAAAFLASSLASAITGSVIYVHNGLDAMGDGAESLTF